MKDIDPDIEEEIRKISRNTGTLNDKIETQHQNNQLRQQARTTENAHFLVSLAVLSALITYYFKNDGLNISSRVMQTTGPFDAILVVAAASVGLFIPLKLFLTTVQPVTDSDWLNNFNDLFLPWINVALVVNIFPLLLIFAFFPDFECEYFTIKYIGIATVVSIAPGYLYLPRYQKVMRKVRATSTRRNIIVTSQPGNSDGKVRLTNPNSTSVPGEEVNLRVNAPSNVSVDIGQTTGDPDEEAELELAVPLPANNVMDLPVTINSAADDPEGEIEITVKVADQPPQTTTISYGVPSDHSGTTNIG